MVRRFLVGAMVMALALGLLPAEQMEASQITQLELADLPARSQIVMLGKVEQVAKKDKQFDEVTVKVASVLKGTVKGDKVKVTLQPRGVKGFDPELKAGDTGVFFLREITRSGAKLAYWGSVAVFGMPSFTVTRKGIGVDTNKVKLETSMGDIVVELNAKAAPVTVENFLKYVEQGFFNGTVFHRVIPGFMVQGGGMEANLQKKSTLAPIVNEANNGLKNDRGTLAMARTNDPDSATSQFFINHKDNDFLNYGGAGNPGYAVFAKVVEGMDVVDKIAAVKTTTKGRNADVPVKPVVIKSATVVAD